MLVTFISTTPYILIVAYLKFKLLLSVLPQISWPAGLWEILTPDIPQRFFRPNAHTFHQYKTKVCN